MYLVLLILSFILFCLLLGAGFGIALNKLSKKSKLLCERDEMIQSVSIQVT